MIRCFSLSSASALVLLAGVVGTPKAKADPVTTNIAIPYTANGLYANWSGAVNGSSIAAAPTNGNAGSGITFADWSGQFNQINPGQTTTFSIPSVALGSASTVNSLFNTFYGDAGTDAIVTFTNSANQTAVYDLVGGQTIRDYNQNSYQNGLSGAGVGVTAQNWWNNGASGQRLDLQSFLLPTAWAGTDLTSFTVYDPTTPPANPSPADVLSALQVISNPSTTPPAVTPEPSSILLLGTGLLGVAGTMRRRFARTK